MSTSSTAPDALTPAPDPSARARLLQAAVEVFNRKGYAASSVREIVEAAGVTKPVLYYYFGSKEGLLLALLNRAVADLKAAIAGADTGSGSARDRVRGVCSAVYRMVRAQCSELRFSHAVYFSASELVPTFDFQVFDRILVGAFEQIVRDGIDAGELRPAAPEDMARPFLGVLMLCIDQEMHHGGGPLDEAGFHRVIDLVFDGLCRPA